MRLRVKKTRREDISPPGMSQVLGQGSADLRFSASHLTPSVMVEAALNHNLKIKNPPAHAGDIRDLGLIPGSGRPTGEGIGYPLHDLPKDTVAVTSRNPNPAGQCPASPSWRKFSPFSVTVRLFTWLATSRLYATKSEGKLAKIQILPNKCLSAA